MRPKLRPLEETCKNCGVIFPPKERGQILCSMQCKYEYAVKQKQEEWKCQQCGTTKVVSLSQDKKRKYCSRKCSAVAAQGIARPHRGKRSKEEILKVCGMCGASFTSDRNDRIFCSKACAAKSLEVDRVPNLCKFCSESFLTLPCDTRRFCSRKCQDSWRRVEWEAGRLMLKAKPEDIKYRNITSRTKERERLKTGQPHRKWRGAVLARDGNECQECGDNSKLHVHHIREFAFFPNDRYKVENGITLCGRCHDKLHKNMKRAGIIGLGWVGEFMNKTFPDALVYDPKRPEYHTKDQINRYCDVAFICVPTPNMPDGSLDISIVEESVAWCTCPIIVVRSTLNPGTADRLAVKYKRRIVVQPEYLGESHMHPLTDPKGRDFMILGGESRDVQEVIGLYTKAYNANVNVRRVTAREAEVIKLSENRAIAFKVAQCQELFDVCEASGVDYYTVRQAVYGDDPRFNLWFSFIYPNKRGMDSKCIPKDVYAWAAWAESLGYNPEVTKTILAKNKDWVALNVPESEDEELEQISTREEIDIFHRIYEMSMTNNSSIMGEERSSYRNDKWENAWINRIKDTDASSNHKV